MHSLFRSLATHPAWTYLLVMCAAGNVSVAEPTPPRAGMSQSRSGTTNAFGSGTITHRSDGTTSQTRPFGSGSLTT